MSGLPAKGTSCGPAGTKNKAAFAGVRMKIFVFHAGWRVIRAKILFCPRTEGIMVSHRGNDPERSFSLPNDWFGATPCSVSPSDNHDNVKRAKGVDRGSPAHTFFTRSACRQTRSRPAFGRACRGPNIFHHLLVLLLRGPHRVSTAKGMGDKTICITC